MAEPLSLHIAAKKVLDQFGQDTLKTLKFANLISDFRGYDEFPATQKILKDILSKGYGGKILTNVRTMPKTKVPSGCKDFIAQYKQKSGYKEDLVSYIFDCIFYALGCIDHVNSPFSKGYEAKKASSSDSFGRLQEDLNKFKKQYVDELDNLVVQPVDILFDAPAYFTTHSLNLLNRIEERINLLQKQLGNHNTSWCQTQRINFLDAKKKEKLDAVTKELKKDKDNYLSLMSSLATKPGRIIKKSYYFDSEAEKQLNDAEERIKELYQNIPKKYDDWCEQEKEKFLKNHSVTPKDSTKQIINKIFAPVTVLLIILFGGVNYVTSIDDIDKFEQTINDGNNKIKDGDFSSGFSLFKKAKSEYDGGWMKTSYENSAQEEINKAIEILISNCEDALNAKEYGNANNLLKQLPENLIAEDSKEEAAVNRIKENISNALETEIDNLIENISQNNGNLDADGIKLLDNLLILAPDDYWLNFIKNKQ